MSDAKNQSQQSSIIIPCLKLSFLQNPLGLGEMWRNRKYATYHPQLLWIWKSGLEVPLSSIGQPLQNLCPETILKTKYYAMTQLSTQGSFQYNTTCEAFIKNKQIKPRRKWHKMMSLHKMNQHRSATHNTNHNWVLSQDEEQ
jgi:hypothetical protein